MTRIIDSVLVYDDGPDKSTELDQRMPVTTVARQPRRLDRKDGADELPGTIGEPVLTAAALRIV